MPLLNTFGAASVKGFGRGIGGSQVTYVDDVFSAYTYTGNGSTQTINNGIPLSGSAAWWAGKLQQNTSQGAGIATDSSGNVYVSG